jgi:hypothetical protein
MANNTSQHILNTSANLLGFCLFVITSLKLANRSESLMIDGFTSIVALLLTLSCFFSFFSLKTSNQVKEHRLESFANYFFIVSLTGILAIILLVAFNFIH